MRGHRAIEAVIAAVVIALLVVGLVTYDAPKNNHRVPADGGAICQNPASALGKATLDAMLANGAGFMGRRPVIADRRTVLGELRILQTYCPEKLGPYKDHLDDLKFDDTIKG